LPDDRRIRADLTNDACTLYDSAFRIHKTIASTLPANAVTLIKNQNCVRNKRTLIFWISVAISVAAAYLSPPRICSCVCSLCAYRIPDRESLHALRLTALCD